MVVQNTTEYILIGVGAAMFFLATPLIFVGIKKKKKSLVSLALVFALFGGAWAILVILTSSAIIVVEDQNGRPHATELRKLGTWNNHDTLVINHSSVDVRIHPFVYTKYGFGGQQESDTTIPPGTELLFPHDIDYVYPRSPPNTMESKSDSETVYQLVWNPRAGH